MSRIDSCFFGQGEEVRTDTFFQFIEVTALQVGTSDAAIEEHVACKDARSFLAMKDKATGRVSWDMISFQTGIAKGNDIAIGDLFSQFNQWWSAYKVMFLTGLFTFLWSLLLVIPGIIKGYAYSMAMYILAENPEIGAREALRRSQEMMDGHKLELFCLHLSFIGWHLLAIITFGIAYVWVMPYINATVTNFYNDIKN